jgi:hypothetical protein
MGLPHISQGEQPQLWHIYTPFEYPAFNYLKRMQSSAITRPA